MPEEGEIQEPEVAIIALTPDDQVTNLFKIVEDLNTPQSA